MADLAFDGKTDVALGKKFQRRFGNDLLSRTKNTS
jgi:hypothetical protein